MKYAVILGDGMSDLPIPELGGKTPLEAAHTPNMDFLAKRGVLGLASMVPGGMHPASDIANLSVMGYDPRLYYSGRSPLEAVSMGLSLCEGDVAFRCNFVTLSESGGEGWENVRMVDYSAGEISTEESSVLINYLRDELFSGKNLGCTLYPGISYRHCLVFENSKIGADTTPPHDISGKEVSGYLPKGVNSEALNRLMIGAKKLLKNHPVNIKRVKQGLNPANGCWFWGEGVKPSLPLFADKFGLTGGVISAVDLIKGIGICAGLISIDVPGATGILHTNYRGKAEAALKLLEDNDFVYLHVEAPDECGHHADAAGKIEAIEKIDSEIVGVLLAELKKRREDFSLLLLPDHPTPVELMTHTSEPVPFALYRSNEEADGQYCYSEANAAKTGIFRADGFKLMTEFLESRK